MNYRKLFITLYFFLLFTSIFSQTTKDSIVGKIDNSYVVKFDELKKYVGDWNYLRRGRDPKESYKLALDDLIINQLKRFDFFDRGFNKDPEIKKLCAKDITEEIRYSVFDKLFVAKYVNEENARKVYITVDKQVEYNQVFVPFTGEINKAQEDSLEKIVLKIKDIIDTTKNINEIRKKTTLLGYDFSENNIAGWEQDLKDALIHEIYNTKLNEVKALRGFNGYYIIKVTNVKKVEKESYEKMRGKILEVLTNANQESYLRDYEKYKVELFDPKTIVWNENNFKKILNWANIPDFFVEMYTDTLNKVIEKNGSEIIATYKDGKLDFVDYKRLLDNILTVASKDTLTEDFLKDFLVEAIQTDLIVKKAKEVLKEEEYFNPLVKSIPMKHRLAYLYNKVMIIDKIPKINAEVIRKFYDENISTLYYQLEKYTIYARIYSDSLKAAEEIKSIKSGVSFEKYSDSYLIKTYERQRDGSLKSYLSTEPPYLAEAAFKLKLNEVAGPIKYVDKVKGIQYAVIMCNMIRPEKQLTFEEVKQRIKDDYLEVNTEKLFAQVEKNLRAKYKVEIFLNTLNGFLASEKNEK